MKNKFAVITGATSGIGAAYARRFASQGYDLILTGRRKEKIENAAMQIRKEYKVLADVILAELVPGSSRGKFPYRFEKRKSHQYSWKEYKAAYLYFK